MGLQFLPFMCLFGLSWAAADETNQKVNQFNKKVGRHQFIGPPSAPIQFDFVLDCECDGKEKLRNVKRTLKGRMPNPLIRRESCF